VAVRLRGRPFADVVADMVDGVLAANRVPPAEAPRYRSRLVSALDAPTQEPSLPAAQAA
jgi:hypothetical protein